MQRFLNMCEKGGLKFTISTIMLLTFSAHKTGRIKDKDYTHNNTIEGVGMQTGESGTVVHRVEQ